jgi:hypothetical protein
LPISIQELAAKYSVNYEPKGKYTKIWMPCVNQCNVDISFSCNRKSISGQLFGARSRIEVVRGLYCYGRGAASAAEIIRRNAQLSSALEKLVQSTITIHWTGTELYAVDTTSAAASDSTGGLRFISNFKAALEGLCQIEASAVTPDPGVDVVQPRWFIVALLALALAAGVPACIYMITRSIAN